MRKTNSLKVNTAKRCLYRRLRGRRSGVRKGVLGAAGRGGCK